MIKTVLVPASGSDTDAAVFETALAAARACRAHLEFFHLRVSSGEALRYTPHVAFARGKGLHNALQELHDDAERRSNAAAHRFHEFCAQHKLAVADAPTALRRMSASFHEERGNGEEPFIAQARVHDLVVMGRFTRPNGLPPDLLPRLLVACGRPVLIAPPRAPRSLTGTAMVCWKDARETARALTAAMPLLTEAKKVVVSEIDEGRGSGNDAAAVARQLAWHGIRAEPQTIEADSRPIATLLSLAAEACGADLLVMGGYSTGPLRQEIFGGCTRSLLESAELPVFLLH
ncbi:MAG TPA: universal stress protein [Xanthobacteraceae bacterium]|jgi:nucleotide-binding universal stress UspA family protein